MELPAINDALWITLFIIAGVLGYKALLVRLTRKKVQPDFLFLFDVEKIHATTYKLTYETRLKGEVEIIGYNDDDDLSESLLKKEQDAGSYYFKFNPTPFSHIKIVTPYQQIERKLN